MANLWFAFFVDFVLDMFVVNTISCIVEQYFAQYIEIPYCLLREKSLTFV